MINIDINSNTICTFDVISFSQIHRFDFAPKLVDSRLTYPDCCDVIMEGNGGNHGQFKMFIDETDEVQFVGELDDKLCALLTASIELINYIGKRQLIQCDEVVDTHDHKKTKKKKR